KRSIIFILKSVPATALISSERQYCDARCHVASISRVRIFPIIVLVGRIRQINDGAFRTIINLRSPPSAPDAQVLAKRSLPVHLLRYLHVATAARAVDDDGLTAAHPRLTIDDDDGRLRRNHSL